MGIFSTGISIVAPVMGLLLVSTTFYIGELRGGDLLESSRRGVQLAIGLFFISFFSGGVLLVLSICRCISSSVMRMFLYLWTGASILTGLLLTGTLAFDVVYGHDDVPDEDIPDIPEG